MELLFWKKWHFLVLVEFWFLFYNDNDNKSFISSWFQLVIVKLDRVIENEQRNGRKRGHADKIVLQFDRFFESLERRMVWSFQCCRIMWRSRAVFDFTVSNNNNDVL